MYKEFEKEFLGKLDPSNFKGIDTKKPLGLYAIIGKGLLAGDFSTTSVVALIPAANEKDFVDLLPKANLKAEKKGDVYSISIPNVPIDAALQFLEGYAYIDLSTDVIDRKALLDQRTICCECTGCGHAKDSSRSPAGRPEGGWVGNRR